MIMKPYQNFVFDLYGTLVDIRTEECRAFIMSRGYCVRNMSKA